MTLIETGRVCIRPFTMADAEHLYQLNSDPDVLLFTGDEPFESVEAAGEFLAAYDQYQKYGLGRWAVIHKVEDAFIGWCGIKYDPACDEYDIGFRFFKARWSRGYASESARACIDHGFRTPGVTRIVGRAMLENRASIRVLEKIGLRFNRFSDFNGQPGVVYSLEKE